MKIKYGKIYLILLAAICVGVSVIFIEKIFSFNDVITHPTLARQSIELFNESSGNKISSTLEISWIMQGAREEDTPIRWMNHFYNPITGYGLPAFSSAKDWTGQNIKQSLYPKGNQTWQRAIDSYVKGDRQEAFMALGHNLHLIEDMAVPAHTRIDIHLADPFENWAKNNSDWKLVKTSMTKFNNLEEYFNSLANYSNKYFLSEDTINYNVLVDSDTFKKKINGMTTNCVAGNTEGSKFCLIAFIKSKFGAIKYFIDDPVVNSDYYSLLAPKAVSYGAGMIDLFFKEVEKKEKEEAKKSLLEKLKSLISNLYPKSIETNFYSPASFKEVEKEIAEKIGAVAGAAIKENGKVLAVKVTADDLFTPGQTEASSNNSTPAPLPLKEQEIISPLPGKDETVLNKEEEKTENEILGTKVSSGSAFILLGGDGAPPETTITSKPEKISSSSLASFTFSSSEDNSSFSYNLNNNGWESCGGRLNLTGLADGEHIIKVRASDRSGNI
ncbi:MAG: hypothetical protein PHP21_01760, partial [Patescibacteria group bacterium]|nr:hypothetical protein [Patescibacteria group bacterium]